MKKSNFSVQLYKPKYSKSVQVSQLDCIGRIQRDRRTKEVLYESREVNEAVPNMEFICKHKLSADSEPHEWFDIFLFLGECCHHNFEDPKFLSLWQILSGIPISRLFWLMQEEMELSRETLTLSHPNQ